MNPTRIPERIESGEGPDHYKDKRLVETCLLMEQTAKNVFEATGNLNAALWSATAMKHIDRLGTKDSTDIYDELLKIENYTHRARTGEWIQK
jgi:hypothetical protein